MHAHTQMKGSTDYQLAGIKSGKYEIVNQTTYQL